MSRHALTQTEILDLLEVPEDGGSHSPVDDDDADKDYVQPSSSSGSKTEVPLITCSNLPSHTIIPRNNAHMLFAPAESIT